MQQQAFGLVDAIQASIDAEREAAAFYAAAQGKTGNPIGQRLFRQLAEFEGGHIRVLTELRACLPDGGEDVPYDGGKLEIPTPADLVGLAEPNRLSVMAIVELAIEAERKAHVAYRDLARQTSQSACRSLLARLAAEELSHLDLLDHAYAALNDRGEWDWLTGPPKGKTGR